MTRTSCRKKGPAPSVERAGKQDEALSRCAELLSVIRELQTLTLAETGDEDMEIAIAYKGVCMAAYELSGVKAGGVLSEAKRLLDNYGIPQTPGK